MLKEDIATVPDYYQTMAEIAAGKVPGEQLPPGVRLETIVDLWGMTGFCTAKEFEEFLLAAVGSSAPAEDVIFLREELGKYPRGGEIRSWLAKPFRQYMLEQMLWRDRLCALIPGGAYRSLSEAEGSSRPGSGRIG